MTTYADAITAIQSAMVNTRTTFLKPDELRGLIVNLAEALADEILLKAPLASPTLTGVPTAPTAALNTNTTQIATMAAVKAAIDALKASAPSLLDTLDELAAALGDDANFAATVTTALASKVATSRTISAAGLATGGGDLSANRTITVTAASQAEAEAGVSSTVAMTPQRTAQAIAALAPIALSANQNYKNRLPGAAGLLSGEEGVALDFLARDAIVNDYADTLSNVGKPDALLTVTRSTVKYAVNRNRLLSSVAINTLAYDHDPVTGVPKGVLIEPAATNLLTYSQEFDNAAWSKTDSSVTVNAAVAPDGTTTADKLVEGTGSGQHACSQTKTLTANTVYIVSVFLKAAERSKARVQHANVSNWSPSQAVVFDLSTGTIASGSNGSIQAFGNGWYLCSTYSTFGSSTASGGINISIVDGSGSVTYTGDGSSGIYVWGAQLETGSVTTSYIPTTSSSVTRAADAVSIATTAYPHNAAQGVMLAELSMLNVSPAANMGILSLTDGTTSNGHFIRHDTGGTQRGFTIQASVTQMSGTGSAVAANVVSKIAMAWAANDAAVSIGGALIATDGSVTLPTVSVLHLGNLGNNTAHMNGHLRRVAYISRRMTNAEIQAMTA